MYEGTGGGELYQANIFKKGNMGSVRNNYIKRINE